MLIQIKTLCSCHDFICFIHFVYYYPVWLCCCWWPKKNRQFAHASTFKVLHVYFTNEIYLVLLMIRYTKVLLLCRFEMFHDLIEMVNALSTKSWFFFSPFLGIILCFSFIFQRVDLFSYASAYIGLMMIFKSNITTLWTLSRCVEIVYREKKLNKIINAERTTRAHTLNIVFICLFGHFSCIHIICAWRSWFIHVGNVIKISFGRLWFLFGTVRSIRYLNLM